MNMTDRREKSGYTGSESPAEGQDTMIRNPEGKVETALACQKARIYINQGDLETAKACIGELILRKKYNEGSFLQNRIITMDFACEETAYLDAVFDMVDACFNSFRRDMLLELKDSLEMGVHRGFLEDPRYAEGPVQPEEPQSCEKALYVDWDEYMRKLDHLMLWLHKTKQTENQKKILTQILSVLRDYPK